MTVSGLGAPAAGGTGVRLPEPAPPAGAGGPVLPEPGTRDPGAGSVPRRGAEAAPAAGRRVGVLALQGDFAEHRTALARTGASAYEVRSAEDLEEAEALVIPGGESTTMLKLLERFRLREPLTRRLREGMPAFGTCAGAILLAREASDGEPPLGALDLVVRRNAYGPQRYSFEADLEVRGVGTLRAIFIRAPVFESVGDGAQVLARWEGRPVLVRSGPVLAAAFHPELTGDLRLHRYFLEKVCAGSP